MVSNALLGTVVSISPPVFIPSSVVKSLSTPDVGLIVVFTPFCVVFKLFGNVVTSDLTVVLFCSDDVVDEVEGSCFFVDVINCVDDFCVAVNVVDGVAEWVVEVDDCVVDVGSFVVVVACCVVVADDVVVVVNCDVVNSVDDDDVVVVVVVVVVIFVVTGGNVVVFVVVVTLPNVVPESVVTLGNAVVDDPSVSFGQITFSSTLLPGSIGFLETPHLVMDCVDGNVVSFVQSVMLTEVVVDA